MDDTIGERIASVEDENMRMLEEMFDDLGIEPVAPSNPDDRPVDSNEVASRMADITDSNVAALEMMMKDVDRIQKTQKKVREVFEKEQEPKEENEIEEMKKQLQALQ